MCRGERSWKMRHSSAMSSPGDEGAGRKGQETTPLFSVYCAIVTVSKCRARLSSNGALKVQPASSASIIRPISKSRDRKARDPEEPGLVKAARPQPARIVVDMLEIESPGEIDLVVHPEEVPAD